MQTYKHISSYVGYRLPQITQTILLEFIRDCNGIMDENYDSKDISLQHTSVKGFKKNDDKVKDPKLSTENVVRHEFMWILVRIAYDKYMVRSKTFTKVMDSVRECFEKHYLPFMIKYHIHDFRINRYYNESVDNRLKAYLPIFYAYFRSICQSQPGQK